MCQVNHRKFSPQNLHFNLLRLLCVVRSCFAHHLVSANTCKAKPHHSLDVYQPSPSFLPQGREREAGYQPAEAGFSPFFGARVSLLVFASVRDQVGKVWELRCCRIVETRPASLKVRAMHPEHRVIFFFLSFNWTRASCNRITPAIAARPARTFLYMCVRARAFIDWEQSQVIPSLFYDKQSTWRHCIRDWPARSTRTNPSPTLQRRATSSGKVWKGRVRRRANEPGFSSTAGAARTRM